MKPTLPALLLLASAACTSPPSPEPEEPESETLSFVMKSRERTYEDCVAGTEGCTYIRLDYPVLAEVPDDAGPLAESVTGAVNRFILSPLEESAEGAPAPSLPPPALMDAFIERFRAFDESEPGDQGAWFLERKAFVLLNTESVLSLSFVERAYTGGAHGIETFRYEVFDAATAEPLSLVDVVVEGKRAELEALAEKRFREARGIDAEASLEEAGFRFENGSFSLTENFAVEEEGLLFYYNAYEIGPYALGPTELVLYWEELSGLIDPRFEVTAPR